MKFICRPTFRMSFQRRQNRSGIKTMDVKFHTLLSLVKPWPVHTSIFGNFEASSHFQYGSNMVMGGWTHAQWVPVFQYFLTIPVWDNNQIDNEHTSVHGVYSLIALVPVQLNTKVCQMLSWQTKNSLYFINI